VSRAATGSWTERLWSLAQEVLPPWLTARAVVLGTLALAHVVVDRVHPAQAGVSARVHEGLLGWDAGWYEAIARHGYAALGPQSLRFFPLVPLAARVLSFLPGVGVGAALLFVANASSLVGTALLWVLVQRESGDRPLARRTVWLLCLAPPAFTMVMGYAEGTLLVCTVGCFLALRARPSPRWWWAAAAAYLAALTRPLGVLLVLAIGVELVRSWVRWRGPHRVAPVVALFAPLAGLATFLGWSGAALGNTWGPLREQTQAGHHGALSDPFTTIAHDASGLLHHHLGTALDVPWAIAAIALVVVCWLRLPASYSLFATGVVAVGLSGTNLDSFARYALSAFPLVWAGSLFTGGRTVERVVLTLAAAGLAGYSLLAFLNLVVP
jgi:hypothetical protein